MSASEFIRTCQSSHYCSRKVAEAYISDHPKDDYTTDDCIAVYRLGVGREPIQPHGNAIGNGYYSDGAYSGGYTTKRYPHGDSGRREQN